MAPVKFGLFKTRSRDQQEQPSTENLLQDSTSSELATPGSPIPSTSKGQSADADFYSPDISVLHLDSDDEDLDSDDEDVRVYFHNNRTLVARKSDDSRTKRKSLDADFYSHSTPTMSRLESDDDDNCPQMNYQHLTNQSSIDHDDTLPIDDDATSCDANSIQFDETSLAPSEDLSVYCLTKKKNLRSAKEVQQLRDLDMWRASDVEVMQNLLSRSGNLNEQFKWEAIATARGLCTLTDNCACTDCARAKYLAGMADGDGGMSAAPLLSVGCVLQ
ncbi:uncharacterized protein LOC134658962 [Cydia amplana]|uniref:uncharacterized protein LOC134658962 n=1 Tax=Cydia amplana TaxID=1869771 RepID=UPI002FE6A2DF